MNAVKADSTHISSGVSGYIMIRSYEEYSERRIEDEGHYL